MNIHARIARTSIVIFCFTCLVLFSTAETAFATISNPGTANDPIEIEPVGIASRGWDPIEIEPVGIASRGWDPIEIEPVGIAGV